MNGLHSSASPEIQHNRPAREVRGWLEKSRSRAKVASVYLSYAVRSNCFPSRFCLLSPGVSWLVICTVSVKVADYLIMQKRQCWSKGGGSGRKCANCTNGFNEPAPVHHAVDGYKMNSQLALVTALSSGVDAIATTLKP